MLKHNELSHLTKYIADVEMDKLKFSMDSKSKIRKIEDYAFVEQLFKFKSNKIWLLQLDASFLTHKKYIKLTRNKLLLLARQIRNFFPHSY